MNSLSQKNRLQKQEDNQYKDQFILIQDDSSSELIISAMNQINNPSISRFSYIVKNIKKQKNIIIQLDSSPQKQLMSQKNPQIQIIQKQQIPKYIEQSEHTIMKQQKNEVIKNFEDMFVGSLLIIGAPRYYSFHTNDNEIQLQLTNQIYKTNIKLKSTQGSQIKVSVLLGEYLYYLKKSNICKIKFYIRLKQQQKQKQQHNLKYGILNLQQKLGKVIPIRMDIYINQNMFDQNFFEIQRQNFSDKQYEQILQQQLKNKLMLIYLLKKCEVKIINPSLVIPSAKLNFLMRAFRTSTIGHRTKNKKYHQRMINKIKNWRKKLSAASQYYPCIYQNNPQYIKLGVNIKDEYEKIKQKFMYWEDQDQIYFEPKIRQRIRQSLNNYTQSQLNQQETYLLRQMGNENLREIGADIFINADELQTQNKNINQTMMVDQESEQKMKSKEDKQEEDHINKQNNEQLLKKFQKQNKYFAKHKTPLNFLTQLKDYQQQALQWMKMRQEKIKISQLFQKQYFQQRQKENEQFERKLSIFWEEIQLLNGKRLYINHLTGDISDKFQPAKKIKGGILADEMGLGKTVMLLSLLADEQYKKTNLIIVPVSVIKQWQKQIKKHCGEHIKVFNYNEQNKSKRRKIDLNEFQIVLITYGTLAIQFKSYQLAKQKQIKQRDKYIFEYDLQRVILDEAHQIREIDTIQSKAVMNLKGKYKWCLTGTLVQNSIKDLFPILKFLGVQLFSEKKWWNKYIENSASFESKLNIIYSILRPILLRRVKKQTSIQLAQKNYNSIELDFSKQQQKFYEELQKGAIKQINEKLQSQSGYIHIFSIINILRAFCCDPKIILKNYNVQHFEGKTTEEIIKHFFSTKMSEAYKDKSYENLFDAAEQICIICLNKAGDGDPVLTKCGHIFCEVCIKTQLKMRQRCPNCRHNLTQEDLIKKQGIQKEQQKIIQKNAILNEIKTKSTKMQKMIKIIFQIKQRKQKCVIFTQWLQMISLLSTKLKENNIKFAEIKGSMNAQRRQKQIQKFRKNEQCIILIASIRSGNVGLNLQNANNAIFCDPWWNPSQEDQSIGRVHRLGQTKTVNVYKLYMKNSIQEKIIIMNEKKRKLTQQIMMSSQTLKNDKLNAITELIEMMKNGN